MSPSRFKQSDELFAYIWNVTAWVKHIYKSTTNRIPQVTDSYSLQMANFVYR